jgi:cytochrome c-type biogenesis protein CcmE
MTDLDAPGASDAPDLPPLAPPVARRRRVHARYVVAAVVCFGIVVWMLTVLQKNVVYLRPVSDAVAHRSSQGTRTFRMGGTVVAGTIRAIPGGVHFDVTQGGATAAVDHHGDPPDLFKNCAPVVVEGHWQGTTFDSDRLLIRHGSEYNASKRVDSSGCKASS